MIKKIVFTFCIAFLGGGMALFFYHVTGLLEPQKTRIYQKKDMRFPVLSTASTEFSDKQMNFVAAAEKSLNAVVHVKNTAIRQVTDPLDYFFGGSGRRYKQIGMGSGVVISADGYIVTNNHVIENATELEVTLNNKKIYKAVLIGTDPDNDIALLKITADKELNYLSFADSDQVKVGEWVLAVGNPYNLTSTVTAGIVSAKGRDLKGNSNIESFIQTDAAVNSGNSGGALVNLQGQLIGINTAITSKTGAFVGYSFAVPSNITRKIVEDLMEYGDVQKALMGIEFSNREDDLQGVLVLRVTEGGGAKKAGLKKGDIIVKINRVKIKNISDLKGQLNAKRPREIIEVTVLRGGKPLVKKVMLSSRKDLALSYLGFHLEPMTTQQAKKYNLQKAVRISRITNKELKNFGIKKGFILLEINGLRVSTLSQVQNVLSQQNSRRVRLTFLNLKAERESYMYNL